jgi:hypothetical protein
VASTHGGLIFLNLSRMAAEKQTAAAWYLKIKKNQAIKTTA